MDLRVEPWRRLSIKVLMLLNCGVGADSWESPGQHGDQTVNPNGSQSWIFIGRTDAEAPILATWCKEPTHCNKPWCWERSKAGGEGDHREWDVCMASLSVSLSKLQEILKDKQAWCTTDNRVTKSLTLLCDWTTISFKSLIYYGLPWYLSWQRICLQCRRPEFNPWVGKISQQREKLPTPVFLA